MNKRQLKASIISYKMIMERRPLNWREKACLDKMTRAVERLVNLTSREVMMLKMGLPVIDA